MKKLIRTISKARSVLTPARRPPEDPIRSELFGIERLEAHAESLASAQRVTSAAGRGRPLLSRVEDNGRVLRETYRAIAKAVREERSIVPAAEWLVDNFHIVDEQLREIRDDLPVGFYRELPKLAEGHLAGYPRVYGIAWAFVAHTDSRFDPESLRRFVQAYQRVQPLTIGELWAIAITLRVVLVENLRRLAESIVRGRAARQAADALADELLGLDGHLPASTKWETWRAETAPLMTAFAVQLVQRLRDQDPAVTPALRWLDERLAAQGTTSDDIVRLELQRQAAMNVTVRNVIMSMGLMSALDWAAFFESVSLVDDVLRTNGNHADMDFATRDSYRHSIEELARGSGRSEIDVAREAVAQAARTDVPDDRRRDPGFHLVGDGRRTLESILGFRLSPPQRLLRIYLASGALGYLGTIALVTLGVLSLPLIAAWKSGSEWTPLVVLAALAIIPASDLAIAVVNRIVAAIVKPRVLPRLELRDGIGSTFRTMIVVPTLLTTRSDVEEQVERLELHHLANSDGDLRFALLSDWTDAPTETTAGDEALLSTAREGIAALNRRHGAAADGSDRFLLFHRRRSWNESERVWMGWERKRGKLHELDRLLRGATDTSFLPAPNAAGAAPADVRYVITLDADTRLPRGVVKRLVGTMAHPLNRARFDPNAGRVVEGYGVLQPRVTSPLLGRRSSIFQQLISGPSGIDPYAAAVSDVYQDFFGEGSYTGKGIYDLDAFESALAGRAPENALLSHDLFEGVFARAGLVTDVEVFESAPSHYGVASARQHRWARGDWQLLPWIVRAEMPLIGRWKMADNLRRTLSAPTALLTLIVAWTIGGAFPATWTAFVLATIVGPAFLPVLDGLMPRRRGVSKRSHLRALGRDVAQAVVNVAFVFTMLAHQAWSMTDAIVRTLVRMIVTHRRMLEWVTAARTKTGLGLDLWGFHRRMYGAMVLAGFAAVLVAWRQPNVLPAVVPFLLLWGASPTVARWISLPGLATRTMPLSAADALSLRLIARRTWRFFSTFVGPEEHSMPPDNFQEDPQPVVAHRTSPTNLGLYLLSTVAARDFGWIGTLDAVDRLEATLETMQRLERFRGHFFNWYDTRDLRPLDPRYVSSVDSGNLAGHLVALRHACRMFVERPPAASVALAGIEDAALLIRESSLSSTDGWRVRSAAQKALDDALEVFMRAVRAAPKGLDWSRCLADLHEHSRAVTAMARAVVDGDRATSADGRTSEELIVWALALEATIASHVRDGGATSPASADLVQRLTNVAQRADRMVQEMEFGFLFDPIRKLFSIGYRVAGGSLDPSYYDLLASEARLASFVAIAKGEVPVSHWFRLGRALTPVEQDSVLVSWSGSMFEYLMPGLVMNAPLGSLLDQTCRLAVRRQISYGSERGVPWGVSESGYNVRDLEMTYQYSNFGVPGLGLRRGLSDDVVIAPYATALAAMIDPAAAVRNFERLAQSGARGAYGFYEALDYTPSRLPENAEVAVVRAYMAHHQGMSLVALDNVVNEGIMRARFGCEPLVQATDLLLQERTPRDVSVARPVSEDVTRVGDAREFVPSMVRRFTSPHGTLPRTHLLSNGRYAVMITAAGSGYSRWRGTALTRWKEDVTCDVGGTYVFVRDVRSGQLWSAGHQPAGQEPDSYEVVFSEDRAKIARQDGSITTTLDVLVSPEDDAEVRRVSVMNIGTRTRDVELTSYAEVVLATPAADAAHPAFSNLFVRTECVPELDVLLATRRPRSPDEPRLWLAHVMAVEGEAVGDLQWETDRARFLGRGRSIRTPISVIDGRALSNTVGFVLDPIVSLRRRLRVPPGTTARVTFATVFGPSREGVLTVAEKYRDGATFDRAATLAWTRAQVQLRHLGIHPDEAQLFQRLANRVLFLDRSLRPAAELLSRDTGGAPSLWPHGISGDVPIVLVQIDEPEDVGIVRQLLRAHEYWRLKQLDVDLVILNERAPSYVQDLQSMLETLVRTSQSAAARDGQAPPHGKVFILRSDRITNVQRDVLLASARAVLSNRRGTLAEQITREQRPDAPALAAVRTSAATRHVPEPALPPPQLEAFNGLGGFAADGREYVTILRGEECTPAPWINVIANATFGFQVSESGSGYTWSVNSRENQLTPWSNDPVADPPSEAIYVRDQETGELWSPTALPIREPGQCHVARHGHGYSRFEHTSHGITLELLQFVALDDPVKISRLTVRNVSGRRRRLSVTAYVEWVLGVSRSASAPFVVTEIDTGTKAMLARNTWATDFAGRVAFADLRGAQTAWTADRTEFLGRNGIHRRPAALAGGGRLSGRVGPGLDPCGALQSIVELRASEKAEVVFLLGEAATRGDATELITRFRTSDLDAELRHVRDRWDGVLETVQVNTPDRLMDLLLNRWLLYQTLACRVWSRSAFYQAGGAHGFRDQLQDVMALTVAAPEVAREHILRAAARQFEAGDVQHWWHPPSGRGVRTRISDDSIWLPHVVLHYVETTGDSAILGEVVPFLEGPMLATGQDESYFQPNVSSKSATLFEHCARALDRALAVGAHGLPLMGTGDWNDGMNRVGREGRGESVWLAWFLLATLRGFARVADERPGSANASRWREHADSLAKAIETHAWDGDWYRRAFFDDGTALGSAAGEECRIDSIAQSWAVLSGAGEPARVARAMQALDEHLVRRNDGLVVLLAPPFDRTPLEPGYIKGYPPGIRENGGQYTHAAVWAVMAFAKLGDGDKAQALFSMLNPIEHAKTRADVDRYGVEPYVVAGDVYDEHAHVGRGGWTWYTGSAGWMYRAGLESLLGFRLRGSHLLLDPCIPRRWRAFGITFKYRTSRYEVSVENPHGVMRGVSVIQVDGSVATADDGQVRLVDDGGTHRVRVVLG